LNADFLSPGQGLLELRRRVPPSLKLATAGSSKELLDFLQLDDAA